MREDLSTEALYESLGPDSRREAARLAARLQAEDGEAARVVAAARAAGVEDRFLREAVAHLRGDSGRERKSPPILTVALALAFFFAQGYAGAVAFGDVSGGNLWIPILLAGGLGASLPRRRSLVLAPLAVAATWLMTTVFYLAVSRMTGWRVPEASSVLVAWIAVAEFALAFGGALVVNARADARRLRETM